MFSNSFSKVADEIEVIKSRSIATQVADDLNLNIQYFVLGQVKTQEIFEKKPVNINFLFPDSIVKTIDTSFFIKIVSKTHFELSNINDKHILEFNHNDSKRYAFGDKIPSRYGELIITPNIGNYGSEPNSYVQIKLTPLYNIVEGYQSKIKIENDLKSNVLRLSLIETSPQKAITVLNKFIEKYNDDVVNDKELIVKATSDFITSRLNIVSNELENVDFTAEKLQKDNRLTALQAQSSIYLQSERENESKIISTANQLQLIDFMSDHLQENNRNSDLLPADVGIADSNISEITKIHNELVLQRNRILKNSSEKNPTVINLDNQIQALKENLNTSLENIRSANKITLDNLNREDVRISSQIYSAPGKERQFRDIKRQQDIKESLYLYLLQKREETAISLGMSSPNAKIIDQAYALGTPVNPKTKIIYLAAFLLGLFIPISIIYTRDLLDTKIHTKDDLIKLVSAPYLGDIPKSLHKERIVKKVDYSPKAEAFRLLRTNISFMLKDKQSKGKTVFVTSTTSQEGKSFTSLNLASSLSHSEKKVLLIETDIRVPKIKQYLNLNCNVGLTDFISDNSIELKDVITAVIDNEFLKVIPAGTIPPNPAELLMSDKVQQVFDFAKKEFDYVIVDTAAVGLVTDTLLISNYADLFLYVVSANNVDKRQLHIAQTMYNEKRLPNMCVILNGTEQKKGYGYGYGNNPNRKKSLWKKLFS
jgi:capsular exopolysaccharide synthesis family protein